MLVTPHCSGWTEQHLDRRWRAIAAQFDRFARGEPVEHVIRPGT